MFTKKVEPGQRWGGKQHHVLTVMSVEMGGKPENPPTHPQVNYAKCRADWDNGSMNVVWISVQTLIGDYRLLPPKIEKVESFG